MLRHVGRCFSVALAVSLATACGGESPGLSDGVWYGKVVAVNVPDRQLTFAPACTFKSGRWIAVPVGRRDQVTATISPHADLAIYFRPNGDAAAGHGQSVGLTQLADVALHGRLPRFPPGWSVTVRDRTVVSVEQNSGIRSTGKADKRTFACIWSRSTQAFVSR